MHVYHAFVWWVEKPSLFFHNTQNPLDMCKTKGQRTVPTFFPFFFLPTVGWSVGFYYFFWSSISDEREGRAGKKTKRKKEKKKKIATALRATSCWILRIVSRTLAVPIIDSMFKIAKSFRSCSSSSTSPS
jgi:hypothetical protein